jgi:hypothetical protein
VQLLIYFILAVVTLCLSLGLGVELMGYAYDPHMEMTIPTNGAFTGPWQFVGLMMITFFGTASIMLWANFIPSLAVLQLKPSVLQAVLALVAAGCIIGTALVMRYLIEAQSTFAESLVTGTEDPIRAAVGAFFVVGFGFLFIITVSMMVNASPWGVVRRFREGAFAWAVTMRYRVTGTLLLMGFLG